MRKVRRRGWWLVVVLAAAGLFSLTASWWLQPVQEMVRGYFRLDWPEMDQRASVVSMFLGATGLLSSLVLGVAQLRQASRQAASAADGLDPDREWERRLRTYQGHQRLPQMKAVTSRQARIHTAIPAPIQPPGLARWKWRPRAAGLDPELPLFVKRTLLPEVEQWMRRARREGGFLLLVGDSSVGKTRLLYETARQVLGDFRALVPDLGDGGLVNAAAAGGPQKPMVVWLDELQRFLPGPFFAADESVGHVPLTATAVRRLLDSDAPVILVGTLWPGYAGDLRATETDPETGATRPRHPQAVDILNLLTGSLSVTSFSGAERVEAARLAGQDPRLATAVAHLDYNVTETLAGAPAILRRYNEALLEQRAVIHAAVDARRMGIQRPLTRDLLREAARGYLTGVHPDDVWFDRALHALTRSDRREDAATAPLITIADSDHRTVVGYTVTDYLLQHLLRHRRSALLSETTWRALEQHTDHGDDLERLAENADRRMQYALAIRIFRRLARVGVPAVTPRLFELLAAQGRLEELQVWADSGNFMAAAHLVEMLTEQGNLVEAAAVLCRIADFGNSIAAERLGEALAQMLTEQGKHDEAMMMLHPTANRGNIGAAGRLADVLAEMLTEQGKQEELRTRADSGDAHAGLRLAVALYHQHKLDEAVAMLRTIVASKSNLTDPHTAKLYLAKVLIKQGKLQSFSDVVDSPIYTAEARLTAARLRAWANSDHIAAARPATSPADQGKLEELRIRTNSGDTIIAEMRASVLTKQGKFDDAAAVLRLAADSGSYLAAVELAELLVVQGKLDELRQEIHAGNKPAGREVVSLLGAQGRAEEAERLRRWGLEADGSIAQPW